MTAWIPLAFWAAVMVAGVYGLAKLIAWTVIAETRRHRNQGRR